MSEDPKTVDKIPGRFRIGIIAMVMVLAVLGFCISFYIYKNSDDSKDIIIALVAILAGIPSSVVGYFYARSNQ